MTPEKITDEELELISSGSHQPLFSEDDHGWMSVKKSQGII